MLNMNFATIFASIKTFFGGKSSLSKEIENEKDLLSQALSSQWPNANQILKPARKLIDLGVAKKDVAGLLAGHTNLFEVMEFTIDLQPDLAKTYGDVCYDAAQRHLTLCGHVDRAQLARNTVRFAAKCYMMANSQPKGFQEFHNNVFEKTSWAFSKPA